MNKNKKEIKKTTRNTQWVTVLLIIFWILVYNIINGVSLYFPNLNQKALISRFSPIHFTSPGNDFAGWLFWLATKSLESPIEISIEGEPSKTCYRQVRWIYYNMARGERLWPLDQDTLAEFILQNNSYENLTLTGWFYTSCKGGNPYSIFGYISHSYWGNTYSMIAWTKLNYTNNTYIPEFSNSLEYFNNIVPLGFLWDSAGGIGFIWGRLTGANNLITYLNWTGTINKAFYSLTGNKIFSVNSLLWNIEQWTGNAQDTMWNILIQWNILLTNSISIYEQKAFLWNLDKKAFLITTDINFSNLINIANKNAELLCRGKKPLVDTTLETVASTAKILCFDFTNKTSNNTLTIDLSNEASFKWKTIIVKWGDVILENSMQKASAPLDLFVNEKNVYIKNIVSNTNKIFFDEKWYPTGTSSGASQWMFVKGTIIINWLVLWGTPTKKDEVEQKLHVLWRVAFLNTPTTPNPGRVTQVENILGTGVFNNDINLENVFTWYCNTNGSGSDDTLCLGEQNTSLTPFVVLHTIYPSNIVK